MADPTTSSAPGTRRSSSRVITLSVTTKTNRTTFLWLKRVTAFNPRVHCARCLVGRYSDIFSFGSQPAGVTVSGREPAEDGEVLYLCGVTWNYANNLHIPMTPSDGGIITFENPDFRVRITGAEQIEFPPLGAEHDDLSPEFRTCRNYQFGIYASSKGLIPASS